jgi:2-dehydropantoate 2-reductase
LATILDRDPDADLGVIASGRRAERLRDEGVWANGTHYMVDVVEPGQTPPELIIVSVKTTALEDSLADLAGFVGPGTALLSLLNGVSSEQTLRAAFPEAYVPLAYSVRSNAGRDECGFRFYSPGVDVFGEPGGRVTPAIRRIDELLGEYGVAHEVSADIEAGQWQKFVLNVGVNQASALLRASYAVFQRPGGQARELMVSLQREALAVAQARGVGLTPADLDEVLAIIDALAPAGHTSMSQDAMARRPMEIEAFGGEVLRLGRQHGVPTPVNETAVRALRGLEESWAV